MRVGRRFNEGGSIRGLARGGGLRVGRWRVHGAGADGHAGTDARVHTTTQRTTRMLVFVVRPDALNKIGHRSPSPPFSLRRVTAIT